VLAAVTRLVHDVGLTVVMAEHRLERVAHLADRIIVVDGSTPTIDHPAAAMARAPVAPPVVELGRRLGWDPLPLSVRDARTLAAPLRATLAIEGPGTVAPPAPATTPAASSEPVIVARRLDLRYGRISAVSGVDLEVRPGEIVAVMGRNGAGKSTLLGALAGLTPPSSGVVRVAGLDAHAVTGTERIAAVGFVPQDAALLLYAESVGEECAGADREGGLARGTTAAMLGRLMPGLPSDRHPRALSEGQRVGLALAVVMAHSPRVLLLDEPTRGLDYPAKARLASMIEALAAEGVAVVFATHDVELAASVAHRVVVMAGGEVIADGPARDVVCQSTVFAPQIAKVMAPNAWLTLAEVVTALDPDQILEVGR